MFEKISKFGPKNREKNRASENILVTIFGPDGPDRQN